MTAINKPGTGPDANLNLQDRSTWVMILAALGAVLTKAVPAVAHWHIDQLYPASAILGAAIIIAAGLVSKHHLAAGIATGGAAAIPVAGELLNAVGHPLDAELAARLQAVEAALVDLKDRPPGTVTADQVRQALGQIFLPNTGGGVTVSAGPAPTTVETTTVGAVDPSSTGTAS